MIFSNKITYFSVESKILRNPQFYNSNAVSIGPSKYKNPRGNNFSLFAIKLKTIT